PPCLLEVGAANATRAYLDSDLAGAGMGFRALDEDEGPAVDGPRPLDGPGPHSLFWAASSPVAVAALVAGGLASAMPSALRREATRARRARAKASCRCGAVRAVRRDRKSTRLNSSHSQISYAVFCLKKKKI